MILKELDPFASSDKLLVAGRKAEEQMAHYLRRFFGNSGDVDVLNYLRISLGGEVAQMDHLVLHPFGLTIVESKSVAGSVQIKDDGQWIRWFNKQPQGMRSPVTQARMQAMLLKDLLSQAVKQKGFFDGVDIDVLVAISDAGTIQWPASGSLPEVCKADQVPEKVQLKINSRRQQQAPEPLSPQHRDVIGTFLKAVHQPLPGPKPTASPVAVAPQIIAPAPPEGSRFKEMHFGRAPALPEKVCKHCGGAHLDAQYGKFGYYFACKTCEKNTGIKFSCPACGQEGRVRKQGKDFYAECKACDASTLYHSNS